LRPNAEVYEKLGLAHFLGNSYPQAVEAFSAALRMEPQRWASHLFMAESLYKLNRFEEALPSVKTALQLRPEENEARYWLGCIDHALGKYDEAIVHLSEASEHDPQNVDILYSLIEADLDDIWLYNAKESESMERADHFLDRFVAFFSLLAENPYLGRRRDDLRPGYRSFPVGEFIVIYRVAPGGEILVLRIIRGSRDIQGLLGE